LDFDFVAQQLLQQPLGEGDCFGTHVLRSLVVLLRVQSTYPILSPEVEGKVAEHLGAAVARLERVQCRNGAWTPGWMVDFPDAGARDRFEALMTEAPSKLAHATGHHLEWIALLPTAIHPKRQVLEAAVGWTLGAVERATVDEISRDLCPYSHCFRVLKMVYGPRFPSSEGRDGNAASGSNRVSVLSGRRIGSRSGAEDA
jgi:hypothetical protein